MTSSELRLVLEHWRSTSPFELGECDLRIAIDLDAAVAEVQTGDAARETALSPQLADELRLRCADSGLPGRKYSFEQYDHGGWFGDTVRLSGTVAGREVKVSYGGWAVETSRCAHAADLKALLLTICEVGGALAQSQTFVGMLCPLLHQIEVTEPAIRPAVYEFEDFPIVIGRAPDCDIQLLQPMIGSHHARISRDGLGFVLDDLGSTIGIFRDGQRTSHSVLKAGDSFELGPLEIRFFPR